MSFIILNERDSRRIDVIYYNYFSSQMNMFARFDDNLSMALRLFNIYRKQNVMDGQIGL